ncbi:MAG: protein kinase [Chitinophagaceae bacterium]|nr:protein kinase [Oligoflexus sp.]
MIETLIGQRYRIKALIGEGGMASVYSALDEKLERRVAIKILHPHLARNSDIRERFILEAKTVSGLDHPNILRVYDFSGLESEQLWMVTEILYGEDLADYVKAFPRHRLQFIVATLVTREICRALNEAHKLNIVHRDIKPENIMMQTNGQVKLMDFGIAKVNRANATQTGIFMGSPSYMSPEQIRGTDVDYRADIYSLSVLFYEIVTGSLPFLGKTTAEVINRIMVGRYTPPNMLITDLPFGLNHVIVKGMQGQKEERFQSVTEMAQALDEFLQNCNMRESRTELEEFSQNREKFEDRLASIIAPKTTVPEATAPVTPDEKSPTFRSKVTRYHASYEDQARFEAEGKLSALSPRAPGHIEPNSTVILNESMIPTLPPKTPVSIKLTLSQEKPDVEEDFSKTDPSPVRTNSAESAKVVQPLASKPEEAEPEAIVPLIPKSPNQGMGQSAAPSQNQKPNQNENQIEKPRRQATVMPGEMNIKAQTIAPGTRNPRQTTGNFQSPMRSHTQPPRTPSQAINPRATQHKGFYREFVEDDKKQLKSSNFGIYTLLAVATAIAVFFIFFGGDRITRSFVRQLSGRPPIADNGARSKKPKVDPVMVETPAPVPSLPETVAVDPEDTQTTASEPVPSAAPLPADNKPKSKVQTNVVVSPTVKPPLFTKKTPTKDGTPAPAPGPGSGSSPAKRLEAPPATLASIPTDKAPDDKVPETTKKDKPTATDQGVLRLAALPAAEVYIDGKMYGTTNDKQIGAIGLKLDPGSYKVSLRRKGYKTEEQSIQVDAGKMRQVSVTLTKVAEMVELSIRSNKVPTSVVIEENRAGGRRRELPMVKHSIQINLKPGSYKVTVSHEQETINRVMELKEEDKSLTFNADFK